MTGYFWGLLAFAICCAVVELLAPSGEGGGVAGHIKWMSALCLLCVLVTPIAKVLSGEGDLIGRMEAAIDDWLTEGEQAQDKYDEQWQQQYEELDVRYAEAAVSLMLQQRFDILAEDVQVTLQVDEQKTHITAVCVGLGGQAIWLNTHEIEAYIEQTLGCECTTYIN